MPTGFYSTRPARMSDLVLWESEPTFVRQAGPVLIDVGQSEVEVGTIVVYDTTVGPEWRPITAATPVPGSAGPFMNGSVSPSYGLVMDRVVRENGDLTTTATVEGIILVHGPATINRDGIKWPAGIAAADVANWEIAFQAVGIKILD